MFPHDLIQIIHFLAGLLYRFYPVLLCEPYQEVHDLDLGCLYTFSTVKISNYLFFFAL